VNVTRHKGAIMKLYPRIFLFFLTVAVIAFSDTSPGSAQTEPSPDRDGTISGQVLIKGNTPMVNGIVLLYNKSMGPPPHPYKYWRIPDLISGTDKDGKFSVEVSEGTYYLMVAQKNPEGEIGPPKESEFLYFHGDAKGNPRPLIITPGAKINLGVLTKSFVWSPNMIPHDKGITAVEGSVVDREGRPVERAVVFAYLSKDAVGRPAFISDRTDKNGTYQLRLHSGGTYYLKVRSVIGGGAPEAGEFQNTTKEFEPVMVRLTKGQKLKGVTLKVEKFSGKGSTGTVKSEKIWKNTGNLQAQ
jgi:hypothetical protein